MTPGGQGLNVVKLVESRHRKRFDRSEAKNSEHHTARANKRNRNQGGPQSNARHANWGGNSTRINKQHRVMIGTPKTRKILEGGGTGGKTLTNKDQY